MYKCTYIPVDKYFIDQYIEVTNHRRVQRGGSGGPHPPPFPGPPFSSVTPPPTQPDLTGKCNVNCFLIV